MIYPQCLHSARLSASLSAHLSAHLQAHLSAHLLIHLSFFATVMHNDEEISFVSDKVSKIIQKLKKMKIKDKSKLKSFILTSIEASLKKYHFI